MLPPPPPPPAAPITMQRLLVPYQMFEGGTVESAAEGLADIARKGEWADVLSVSPIDDRVLYVFDEEFFTLFWRSQAIA